MKAQMGLVLYCSILCRRYSVVGKVYLERRGSTVEEGRDRIEFLEGTEKCPCFRLVDSAKRGYFGSLWTKLGGGERNLLGDFWDKTVQNTEVGRYGGIYKVEREWEESLISWRKRGQEEGDMEVVWRQMPPRRRCQMVMVMVLFHSSWWRCCAFLSCCCCCCWKLSEFLERRKKEGQKEICGKNK